MHCPGTLPLSLSRYHAVLPDAQPPGAGPDIAMAEAPLSNRGAYSPEQPWCWPWLQDAGWAPNRPCAETLQTGLAVL